MAEEAQGKWEGKATVELKGPTADQVWPFFEDFCNLQKWLPLVDSCHRVEGELGQPGLVRLCKFSKVSSDGSHEETEIKWAKEKLIMIDPNERCLSYEILENNVGFKSYVATIKVLPINDGDGDGHHGCEIEWSFITDPIEGWPLEDFNSYISSSLQFMGQKMEQAVLSRRTTALENAHPLSNMAEEKAQIKWEGKSIAELRGPTADQIWSLLEDFCNINKWFPSIDVCNQVGGELGKPGLTRYCASKTLSTYGSYDEGEVRWVKERLLMINPAEKCLSYEVLENNSGFKSYMATMKVLEINGSDAGENGCKIEWSFIADPVEGWTFEDFNSFINFCLQSMGKNMEQDVLSG